MVVKYTVYLAALKKYLLSDSELVLFLPYDIQIHGSNSLFLKHTRKNPETQLNKNSTQGLTQFQNDSEVCQFFTMLVKS